MEYLELFEYISVMITFQANCLHVLYTNTVLSVCVCVFVVVCVIVMSIILSVA